MFQITLHSFLFADLLYLSILSFGYQCPLLNAVDAYVGGLDGFQTVTLHTAPLTHLNESFDGMQSYASKCTVGYRCLKLTSHQEICLLSFHHPLAHSIALHLPYLSRT
ncbi:MAG: hypothetical protein EXX96DRAFT_383430 [Benjaminiella poitrasii]|nr:MAG: hypothetical protein EXX96DRAFT_383430 [Benjaminiella poitrasii]